MTLTTTRRGQRVSLLARVLGGLLRVSVPVSIIAALLSTLVLAATLAHLFLHFVLEPQQVVLLGWATVAGLVLGAVGIAAMLYRWWLILRRRRPFRWRDEVTDQLFNIPDYAQDFAQQIPQLATMPGRIATVGSAVSRPGSTAAAIAIQPIATVIVVATLAPAIALGGPPRLVPPQAAVGASLVSAPTTPTPPRSTTVTAATPTATVTATPTATPTATATPKPLYPYSAPVPGPGCDPNGNWTGMQGTRGVTCLSDRVQLTGFDRGDGCPYNLLTFTRTPFPEKYTMSIHAIGVYSGTTIGIYLGTQAYNYGFYLFPGNAWHVERAPAGGSNQIILQGSYTSASSYALAISLNGATSTFAINGTPVSYTETTPSAPSGSIAFSVAAVCGTTTDYADFQNFSVSPLS